MLTTRNHLSVLYLIGVKTPRWLLVQSLCSPVKIMRLEYDRYEFGGNLMCVINGIFVLKPAFAAACAHLEASKPKPFRCGSRLLPLQLQIEPAMGRGALVVFEGTDRSGKTTQTKRCVAALRCAGVPVADGIPWRFPDRTTAIGGMIDAYLSKTADLDDKALHLLFSANRWEKVSAINKALESGETVVLDRYAFSGVAYSAAKGLSFDWCKSSDTGLPTPDVVVYLDLPFDVAAKRGEFGAERYENENMQRAVSFQFQKFCSSVANWNVVDADDGHETVFDRVMNVVMPAVVKARNSSDRIGSLW
jgi:dTMP kinase